MGWGFGGNVLGESVGFVQVTLVGEWGEYLGFAMSFYKFDLKDICVDFIGDFVCFFIDLFCGDIVFRNCFDVFDVYWNLSEIFIQAFNFVAVGYSAHDR